MRKKRKKQVEKVSPEQQQKKVRRWFAKAKDNRARNSQHKISDVLMSAYSMFSLKYSSLLQFEQQTPTERENLKKVYGVEKLCSDAQMRRILDEQCPEYSKRYFRLTYEELKKEKVLKKYQYYKGYIPLAWDGVHHFSSKKVNCDHCTKKEHKTGETTYSHSMLCAAIVCPGKSEVFVVGAEPIRCEDGATKNDCEQNASKRLMSWMSDVYKDEPLLFLEDALYSKGPNIREILANPNWAFVLNIKPDGNKSLFVPGHPRAKKHRIEENGVVLNFEYINNLPLNNSQGDLLREAFALPCGRR